MKSNIGIADKNRQAVADELAKILADELILYTKTRNAHWNVEGADFHDKHKFFESQFGELDEFIDDVAERIRTLGHYVPSTLSDFLKLTSLSEASRAKNDSKGFIKELLEDHETIIIRLREKIKAFADKYNDAGTSDFITGLMEKHEKMAWFLRSHLN
jgi:starvation-inducible DNA-binding protein